MDRENKHKFIFDASFYENLKETNNETPLNNIGEEPKIDNTIEEPKDNIDTSFKGFLNNDSLSEIDNRTITEQIDNIETNNNIETIKETEDTSINNNIDKNNFNNDLLNSLNIQKPKEETIEEKVNTYDVNTGIDKELENNILNQNTEIEEKKQQDEYVIPEEYRIYLQDKNQKRTYRAIRNNQNTNTNIFNYNTISNNIVNNNNIVNEKELKDDYDFNNIIEEEQEEWVPPTSPEPVHIDEDIKPDVDETLKINAKISTLLDELKEKEKQSGKISILAKYGDDFCSRNYLTNPAIARDEELKELILILLTPEKSGILVGKPGIGKTSIVEGLAYRLQRDLVPDALKGFVIISVKTTSIIGTLPNGETRLQALIDELKDLDKIILFIDEVHMLMGANNESSLDFANMFKESLGRGSIKMIGATTDQEYERYVLRDKAFVRRFSRVDVKEPSEIDTVRIVMGTLPKIEKETNAKMKYSVFVTKEIVEFLVSITSEYKRVYAIGSRYPDICLTLLKQAFSEAIFNNRSEVNIIDVRNAIKGSKNIYPDVITKELVNFDKKFKKYIDEEQ